MILSYTSIAYSLLFLSLGFLAYRFFQYWIRSRTTTSKLFFFLALSFFLFALVTAIRVLFFTDSFEALKNSIVAASFIEGVAASVVAYLIIHLKFPKISPWVGFIVVFLLGIWATILTTAIDYQSLIGKNGVIDWEFPTFEVSTPYLIIRFGIILISFIPLIVILLQQFFSSEDHTIRKRALGLSIVFFLGVGLGFIDFILGNFLREGAVIYRAYTIIILSFCIFLLTLITQKPSYRLE